VNLPAGRNVPAVLFPASEDAGIAINSVADHVRIYWPAADFVPKNRSFLPVFSHLQACKSRQSAKC
jgi:hypothetical protein